MVARAEQLNTQFTESFSSKSNNIIAKLREPETRAKILACRQDKAYRINQSEQHGGVLGLAMPLFRRGGTNVEIAAILNTDLLRVQNLRTRLTAKGDLDHPTAKQWAEARSKTKIGLPKNKEGRFTIKQQLTFAFAKSLLTEGVITDDTSSRDVYFEFNRAIGNTIPGDLTKQLIGEAEYKADKVADQGDFSLREKFNGIKMKVDRATSTISKVPAIDEDALASLQYWRANDISGLIASLQDRTSQVKDGKYARELVQVSSFLAHAARDKSLFYYDPDQEIFSPQFVRSVLGISQQFLEMFPNRTIKEIYVKTQQHIITKQFEQLGYKPQLVLPR